MLPSRDLYADMTPAHVHAVDQSAGIGASRLIAVQRSAPAAASFFENGQLLEYIGEAHPSTRVAKM